MSDTPQRLAPQGMPALSRTTVNLMGSISSHNPIRVISTSSSSGNTQQLPARVPTHSVKRKKLQWADMQDFSESQTSEPSRPETPLRLALLSTPAPSRTRVKIMGSISSPSPMRVISTSSSSRNTQQLPARVPTHSVKRKKLQWADMHDLKENQNSEPSMSETPQRLALQSTPAPSRTRVKLVESISSPSPMRVISTSSSSRKTQQLPARVPTHSHSVKRKKLQWADMLDLNENQKAKALGRPLCMTTTHTRFTPYKGPAPARVRVKDGIPSPNPVRVPSTPSARSSPRPLLGVPAHSPAPKSKIPRPTYKDHGR